MPETRDLLTWLRTVCDAYDFDAHGVFKAAGDHDWPLVASDPDDLLSQLGQGGHLLPLPKESAALANILEVSLVDYLLLEIEQLNGAEAIRGTERGYPDLEVFGTAFGDEFHAVDIKAARRKPTRAGFSKNTQSRITLYTGNTYFRYPRLRWPGSPRPFGEYASHLDIIAIYTLDEESPARVLDLELIVQPPWKIGSHQRSSTTREYIGAVMEIAALREGRSEFETETDFYKFWRAYPFKVGKAVQQQLDKLLR